ncbi:hypothetical protein ACA910_014814 [Epithemia clementina (nom. ined.)]
MNTSNNENNEVEVAAADVSGTDTAPEEEAEEAVDKSKPEVLSRKTSSQVHRLSSTKTVGMETSVLKFKNVNFLVGAKDKQQNILTDVSGVVKFGRVLAIMGPSGAGKTTLINALTLNAQYGIAQGSVKLNGKSLSAKIFKEHCFVVQQQDKHWPYLTCRETLFFAAQLYQVVAKEDEALLVNEILDKMGLQVCADTANARLSGGQRRRLSIGLALLKQPRVLFLDEPTSGLDAASAENIMQEIVRVAKEEKLITICTIHQPSTKVYNNFDQVMIMSRGRIAFAGDVKDATPYFENIGYPMPDDTNPAEFFLDLVNSDFTEAAEVTKILDTWEEKGPGVVSSHHSAHGKDEGDEEGVVNLTKHRLAPQITVLFRRQFLMVIRDPILYIGRSIMFFLSNMIFALVYLSARSDNQDQVLNKFWVVIWFVAVPTQLGVVAVYALNDEFKSLLRETKNGMLHGVSYVIAKSCLSLPIMYIFALFSLGVPFFAVIGAPKASYWWSTILFASVYFQFESVAESLSVWFDDPILGMLQFMNFWFGSFLFGGFLIPLRDLYYPFEIFYYFMPYSYYVRSAMYVYFADSTFDNCIPSQNLDQAVCVEAPEGSNTVSGKAVLEALSNVFPLLSAEDETAKDVGIILAVGAAFKLMYIVGVLLRTSQVSKFE